MRPFDSGPRPAVVGHRGSPLRAPENTPPSFAAAVAEGARWVELDARLTRDGTVVVHHDARTPGGVPLVERTAAELGAAGVPDLATVLAGLPERVGVDVELKNLPGEPDFDEEQRLARAVAGVLGEHAGRRPLLVSSFNPEAALAVGAALPGVPAGLLSTAALALDAAVEIAGELGMAALCPHAEAPGLAAGGIVAAHQAGLAVMAWPVDDGDRARALAASGIDALCTNDPAGVLAALGRAPAAGGGAS